MTPPEKTSDAMTVFDRKAVRLHRDRSARNFGEFDFLFRHVGAALADRLQDITRDFPRVLDLGGRDGFFSELIVGHNGIENVFRCDLSEAFMRDGVGLRVVADEEFIPFAPESFDLVISCLDLHWVNDLPGTLVQLRQVLKPDGLFLAAMFGGNTLAELRASLLAAETEITGGAGPRVSPFADVRDAGDLLVRAGFALPVADSFDVTVSYADPLKLMRDLRGMGESNAVRARQRGFTRRDVLARAAAHYQDRHADADGRVPATFEVIMLTAWAPHAAQPKPLARGSGQISLADVLKEDK